MNNKNRSFVCQQVEIEKNMNKKEISYEKVAKHSCCYYEIFLIKKVKY